MAERSGLHFTPTLGGVQVEKDGSHILLTWPEANRAQAEIRQMCVEAGLTMELR
jgi:hypothetical protein